MTSYTSAVNDISRAYSTFERLGTDEQLALLWFIYEQMGHFVTPAAPGSASPEIATGLYNQVKELDHQQQLDAMRAIASCNSESQISREYGSLSSNTRLAFWYYLSKGMDNGEIIPMPDDYELTETGQDLLAAIETMDFEQQITFLRNVSNAMGSEPSSGASI